MRKSSLLPCKHVVVYRDAYGRYCLLWESEPGLTVDVANAECESQVQVLLVPPPASNTTPVQPTLTVSKKVCRGLPIASRPSPLCQRAHALIGAIFWVNTLDSNFNALQPQKSNIYPTCLYRYLPAHLSLQATLPKIQKRRTRRSEGQGQGGGGGGRRGGGRGRGRGKKKKKIP